MATIGFGICLLISIALFIYMGQKNYDNIDIYSWTLVVLIPIIILAYWLKTQASTPETAKYLFCFIYLDRPFSSFPCFALWASMSGPG